MMMMMMMMQLSPAQSGIVVVVGRAMMGGGRCGRCRSQNNGREIRLARAPVMMRPRFIREFLFLKHARPPHDCRRRRRRRCVRVNRFS